MRLFQIISQTAHREVGNLLCRPTRTVLDEVGNSQECQRVHMMSLTNLLDGLFAESQGDTKTRHHLQQRRLIGNHITHVIGCLIVCIEFHVLFLSLLNRANLRIFFD